MEIELHRQLYAGILGGESVAGSCLSLLKIDANSKIPKIILAMNMNSFNVLQVPVALSVSSYEAFSLYKGWRRIESKGEEGTNFRVLQLFVYCFFGILAGMVGGLLGLGGGFIMGPMFLELGVPPQVRLYVMLKWCGAKQIFIFRYIRATNLWLVHFAGYALLSFISADNL